MNFPFSPFFLFQPEVCHLLKHVASVLFILARQMTAGNKPTGSHRARQLLSIHKLALVNEKGPNLYTEGILH